MARALLILVFSWFPLQLSAETLLLMAEEDGCMWCARWNAEISEAYPKTTEGRTAPLVRFDMYDAPPDGITLLSSVRFSPTFILVRNGIEVDRIEGYPGEEFFWGLLGMMLERSEVPFKEAG